MKLFPFEECYLINLVERKDRYKYMVNQFKELGCDDEIQIFHVVKHPDWYLNRFLKGMNNTLPWQGWIDVPSAISCQREHYTLIKSAYLREVESIMIIEDDCGFLKDRRELEKYFNNLPSDWDILRINCLRGPKTQQYIEDFKDKYSYWYPQITMLWGTGAYALSRNGMKYILDWYEQYYASIDTPLAIGHTKRLDSNLIRYKLTDTSNVKFYIPAIPLGLCASEVAHKSDLHQKLNDDVDINKRNIYFLYDRMDGLDKDKYFM